jgi:hypothetical protein
MLFVSGLLVGAKVLKRYFDDDMIIQIGILSMLLSTVIPIYARTDAGLFLSKFNVCVRFKLLPRAVLTQSGEPLTRAQQTITHPLVVTSAPQASPHQVTHSTSRALGADPGEPLE